MVEQNYDVSLSIPFYDQTDASTWDGVPETEAAIASFIKSGCALCALASYKDMTIVEVYEAGACTKTSPYVKSWLGTVKKTTGNYLSYITDRVLNSEKSTIVHVPGGAGHFVTVSGFSGILAIDGRGNPSCGQATANMILINDPYEGRCSTIEDLISEYGGIDYIRQ
ncbi:MAG: hypothetical protein RR313_06325 [Anaerovoracaceae bacterium]